ncbi:MAG TPA: MFS transporter [Acidimicrobiales bacterium]
MYLSSRTPTAGSAERDPDELDGPELDRALELQPAPGVDLVTPPDDPSGGEVTEEEPTGVEGNVVALGVTSMFTDISSEMVASILPLYLTLLYGFSPLQLGLFDGFYQGLAAVMALGAAVAADRRRRLKGMAGFGYGLSTVCTAGLVAAQGAWAWSVSFLYFDRLGKGIRTAPRDAIISLSVRPGRLGRAFGLHRSFDTLGAVAGPVVASIVLARNLNGYQSVFTVAFFASVIGLAAFVFFVDGRRKVLLDRAPDVLPAPAEPPTGPRWFARTRRDISVLLSRSTYRRALLLGGGLALLTPGDGLIYLTFQRDSSLTTAQFPLLYVGGSLVFLLAAYPVGRLADRVGRWRVFIAGEALFVGVLAVLASGQRGVLALVAMVVLLGGRYAATDGVLMAVASSALPSSLRTTGLGVLVAVIALGHLVASTLYGSLWGSLGGAEAARIFAIALAAVTLGGVLLLKRRPPQVDVGARQDAR